MGLEAPEVGKLLVGIESSESSPGVKRSCEEERRNTLTLLSLVADHKN